MAGRGAGTEQRMLRLVQEGWLRDLSQPARPGAPANAEPARRSRARQVAQDVARRMGRGPFDDSAAPGAPR